MSTPSVRPCAAEQQEALRIRHWAPGTEASGTKDQALEDQVEMLKAQGGRLPSMPSMTGVPGLEAGSRLDPGRQPQGTAHLTHLLSRLRGCASCAPEAGFELVGIEPRSGRDSEEDTRPYVCITHHTSKRALSHTVEE